MRSLCVVALVVLTGCLDFRDGLACATDDDCAGYVCQAGVCAAPIDTQADDAGAQGVQVLLDGLGNPDAVTVGADGIFVADADRTGDKPLQLWMVPKTGGSATALMKHDPEWPYFAFLAADGDNVFCGYGRTIYQVTSAGAAGTPLFTSSTGSVVGGIAVDATFVYAGFSDGVYRIPRQGGAATRLADDVTGLEANALVVVGGTVFWSDGSNLDSVATSGGGVASSDAQGSSALSTDGANLYWLQSSAGNQNIDWVRISTGNGAELRTESAIQAVVGDGTSVYWVDLLGDVFSSSLQGGTISEVAASPNQGGSASIAIDSQHVYWTSGNQLLEAPR